MDLDEYNSKIYNFFKKITKNIKIGGIFLFFVNIYLHMIYERRETDAK